MENKIKIGIGAIEKSGQYESDGFFYCDTIASQELPEGDSDGEVIDVGSLTVPDDMPVMVGHRYLGELPIGRVSKSWTTEDSGIKTLWMRLRISLSQGSIVQRIKEKIIDAVSIGFIVDKTPENFVKNESGVTRVFNGLCMEISLVFLPACSTARIQNFYTDKVLNLQSVEATKQNIKNTIAFYGPALALGASIYAGNQLHESNYRMLRNVQAKTKQQISLSPGERLVSELLKEAGLIDNSHSPDYFHFQWTGFPRLLKMRRDQMNQKERLFMDLLSMYLVGQSTGKGEELDATFNQFLRDHETRRLLNSAGITVGVRD